MKSWIHTEVEFLDLGDKRRNDPFRKIVETAADHPTASVPQAQNQWYDHQGNGSILEFTKGGFVAVIAGYWPCMAQRTVGYPIAWVLHGCDDSWVFEQFCQRIRLSGSWPG